MILDQNYYDLALLVLSAIAAGLMATMLSMWIAKKADIIDYPGRSAHKIHSMPTPRSGGIGIILALVVLISAYGLWDERKLLALILPVLIVFAFGLIDDKRGMSAQVKLFGQLLAVTLLIMLGTRVKFLENPNFFIQFGKPLAYWLDIAITFFWMVGITNAMNMVDSMDGLAIGLCQVISGFFLFMAMVSQQAELVYLSAMIFGIIWGVGFFNKQPAKTFLGDSGAQTLGFLLAAIAIAYQPIAYGPASSWFAPIIIFSVPIFDTTLVTVSRLLRGLPFYKANLDHTYHRLTQRGWDSNRAVALMQLAAVVFGLLSVAIVYLPSLFANLLFATWLVMFAILFVVLDRGY